MATEYTRKEREVIAHGWAALMDFAERTRMGDRPQLEDAEKAERANVSKPTIAKALLLRTLAETCDPDNRTGNDPAEWWGYRRAHRDVIAYTLANRQELIDQGVTFAAGQAAHVHQDASRRALDALDT